MPGKRNREEETEAAVDAADDREIEKLERAAREDKRGVRVSQTDEPEDEEFEVGAEDDDDDEPAPQQQQRPGRQERRRQRGDNREEQWREELRIAREDAAEQRSMLAHMINQQNQRQQQAPGQQEQDPEKQRIRDEIKGLNQQHRALIEKHGQLQSSKQLTQEMHDRMTEQSAELQEKLAEARFRLYSPRQQPSLTPQQIQQMTAVQRVQADHPDVCGNPTAWLYYQAAYRELRDPKGPYRMPESFDTVDKAMAKARQLAGLPPKGGRPAPSAGTRAKFTGAPRGGGAGSGGQGGRQSLVMTPQLKELADAAYPHIKDERKRYQHYANTHGKNLSKVS